MTISMNWDAFAEGFYERMPGHSHLEVSTLAEGSQEISKFMKATDYLETRTVPIVHSESRVKGPSAEGGLVSRGGVRLEGKDDTDAQDAPLTMDEIKRAPTCTMALVGFAPLMNVV